MEAFANPSPSELLLGASLMVLVVGAYKYYYNTYTYWARRGVKGPKPLPFVGNFISLILSDRPKFEIDLRKKYGKIYGIFDDSKPVLIIADPKVVRRICIKDFDAFPNHELDDLTKESSKTLIMFMQDDHWKRVRALMSPTFTSGKIRRMFRLLNRCADDLVELFGEQLESTKGSSDVVNMKDMYNMFTMDAITTCCYGLKLERAGSTDLKTAATRNEFVELAMRMFQFSPVRIVVASIIPTALLKLVRFNLRPINALPLVMRVQQLIKDRKKSSKKFDDYLQLLIDAKLEDSLQLSDTDSQENHHAGLTRESLEADHLRMAQEVREKSDGVDENGVAQRQKDILSAQEIVSNAMFLLIVGVETTATLLSNCSYALAFHQDIQERLYEELKQIAEYNEDNTSPTFDYEKLTACRYIDSVISETLRLLTPVLQIDRKASSDYSINEYGIQLQKGSSLKFAFHAIHNDPDYWEEPEKFNPERFMPGNREKIVPGSYCPFGMGPRHCLGMRFSLTEAKLSLAKIMMKYRFEQAPDTQFPPPCKATLNLYNMATPLVRIIRRT